MSASLVGSEMCIRDSSASALAAALRAGPRGSCRVLSWASRRAPPPRSRGCLLYTSDAADDM
eukprot:12928950-Alexandrium_andersonii.AAC.1